MNTVYRCEVSRHQAVELTDQLVKDCDPRIVGLVRSKVSNQDWDRPVNLRDFWFTCYDDVQRLRQADDERSSDFQSARS